MFYWTLPEKRSTSVFTWYAIKQLYLCSNKTRKLTAREAVNYTSSHRKWLCKQATDTALDDSHHGNRPVPDLIQSSEESFIYFYFFLCPTFCSGKAFDPIHERMIIEMEPGSSRFLKHSQVLSFLYLNSKLLWILFFKWVFIKMSLWPSCKIF